MEKRSAQTKTEETAWNLIDRLHGSDCINTFSVVQRSRGGRYEIVANEAVHPMDREIIQRIVSAFKEESATV